MQIENQALELVEQARQEEAKALLFSDEYDHHKQVYAAGMEEFDVRIRQTAQQFLHDEIRSTKTAFVVAAIALSLLLIFWLAALRTLNRWQRALKLSHEMILWQPATRPKRLPRSSPWTRPVP